MMIITFSVELFPPNIKINGGNIYVGRRNNLGEGRSNARQRRRHESGRVWSGVALLTSISFTGCHRESLGFVVSWKL
ncbi:hypothetical protein IGI04_015260 [Brassica rapa subsp. trilocularis]|uniref:Uncharacterized protein n=2 Tax=Brassica campestris TaxID=3711 RepID=M4DSY7_BRACM|nr:hypothetical protein IGI04_015260 [Brassica rapa subsp. trilocularis]